MSGFSWRTKARPLERAGCDAIEQSLVKYNERNNFGGVTYIYSRKEIIVQNPQDINSGLVICVRTSIREMEFDSRNYLAQVTKTIIENGKLRKKYIEGPDLIEQRIARNFVKTYERYVSPQSITSGIIKKDGQTDSALPPPTPRAVR